MIVFIAKRGEESDTLIGKCASIYCALNNVPLPPFEIVREGGKKPEMLPKFVEFNLTHSGEYALLAFSPSAVGIDLEQRRELDAAALSKRFFNQRDSAEILNGRDFFDFWTRKEACLKRTGEGLTPSALRREICDGKVKNYDIFEGYSFAVSSEDEDVSFLPIFITE